MIELLIISLAASFLFTFILFISIKAEISKLQRSRRNPFEEMIGFDITSVLREMREEKPKKKIGRPSKQVIKE